MYVHSVSHTFSLEVSTRLEHLPDDTLRYGALREGLPYHIHLEATRIVFTLPKLLVQKYLATREVHTYN